jgi:hypothetical protein
LRSARWRSGCWRGSYKRNELVIGSGGMKQAYEVEETEVEVEVEVVDGEERSEDGREVGDGV